MSSKTSPIYKYFFTLFFFIAFMAPVGFLYAKEVVRLAPLPSPPAGTVGSGLAGYLQTIFWLSIIFAGVLAVLMITIGGIQYMTSEAFGTKAAAKTQITMAILGFILAVSSVLILQIINPDLLKFKLVVTGLLKPFDLPEDTSLREGDIPGCTAGLVAAPISRCEFVAGSNDGINSRTRICAISKGSLGSPDYNYIDLNKSKCAAEKPTEGGKLYFCCGYVPPSGGCTGSGVLTGATDCRWSSATVGDTCAADHGEEFTKTSDSSCAGVKPGFTSECCATVTPI